MEHSTNSNRATLIAREIDASISPDEVAQIFDNEKCQLRPIKCEFAHLNNWYITFKSNSDATQALKYLRNDIIEFRGKILMARIKTTSAPVCQNDDWQLALLSRDNSISIHREQSPNYTQNTKPAEHDMNQLLQLQLAAQAHYQQQLQLLQLGNNFNHAPDAACFARPMFPTMPLTSPQYFGPASFTAVHNSGASSTYAAASNVRGQYFKPEYVYPPHIPIYHTNGTSMIASLPRLQRQHRVGAQIVGDNHNNNNGTLYYGPTATKR